jgi:hypothetical protein
MNSLTAKFDLTGGALRRPPAGHFCASILASMKVAVAAIAAAPGISL